MSTRRAALFLCAFLVVFVFAIGRGERAEPPPDLTPLPWATGGDVPTLRRMVAERDATIAELRDDLRRAETSRNNFARAVIKLRCTPQP